MPGAKAIEIPARREQPPPTVSFVYIALPKMLKDYS